MTPCCCDCVKIYRLCFPWRVVDPTSPCNIQMEFRMSLSVALKQRGPSRLAHTRTHTRTHTHTHSLSHTHTHSHSPWQKHRYSLTQSLSHSLTHTYRAPQDSQLICFTCYIKKKTQINTLTQTPAHTITHSPRAPENSRIYSIRNTHHTPQDSQQICCMRITKTLLIELDWNSIKTISNDDVKKGWSTCVKREFKGKLTI